MKHERLPQALLEQFQLSAATQIDSKWIRNFSAALLSLFNKQVTPIVQHNTSNEPLGFFMASSTKLLRNEIRKLDRCPQIALKQRPLILPLQTLWLVWLARLKLRQL